jgi:hypothetical protein
MPHDSRARAHTYDYDSIACVCGFALGYKQARSRDRYRCAHCDRPYDQPAPPKVVLAPAVQAFVDAVDNAAARAVGGASPVVEVPASLWDAIVETRFQMEPKP